MTNILKNKFLIRFVIHLLYLTVPYSTTQAEEDSSDFSFSATIGLYSDYVFRGVTQTEEDPAIQGSFDISHEGGLYAGIWASNVDFGAGDDANIEIDYYAGFSSTLFGETLNYDIGGAYYSYPGVDASLNYEYPEFYLLVSHDFKPISAETGIYYAPDSFGSSGPAFYYFGKLGTSLPYHFNLSGQVGYQEVDDIVAFGLPDYLDWWIDLKFDAGAIGSIFKGTILGLTYTDTNISTRDCSDGCDEKVLFYIERTF
jgi:uncharacterized protein (TIGR02001 family)